MKSWLKLPSAQRRGAVICGAYGMANAGDDAALAAVTAALRRLEEDMPITVVARGGGDTGRHVGAAGVGRTNVLGWLRAMGRARLFLLGGGSLVQDVTSRRSLWFYLGMLRAAKAMGCRTMLYGAGIGPVTRERERQRAAACLDAYADVICVRDRGSLQTLRDWSVTRPRLLLSADPALALRPERGERERKAGFVLRPWPGFWAHVPDFAAAARHVWEQYHLAPVFICLAPEDRQAARSLCAALPDVPCAVSQDPKRVGRMAVVVSMRLHGLVFALRDGVPAAGVSYDPKVTAFCAEAGFPLVQLENADADALCELADFAMHMDGEHLSASLRTLRAREQVNANAAAELLAAEDENERKGTE